MRIDSGGANGLSSDGDFAIMSDGKPSYETCANTTGFKSSVGLSDVKANLYVCLRTDEGRLALLHITKLTYSEDYVNPVVTFNVVTWEKP
jgi:hypothetical protein